MPNTTNYPASLVRDAAQVNPAMIEKMKTWKGHYGPDDRAQGVLDRLMLEAGTGKEARLPEKTIFEAKKGNEQAVNEVQFNDSVRNMLLGELMADIDPKDIERFRAKQVAERMAAEQAAKAQGPGLVGGIIDTRDTLNRALRQ